MERVETSADAGDHSDRVMSVSFSPDGCKLASGSGDKTVKLWDVTSGKCLQTMKGHFYAVISVSISPDGTKIASGSRDKTVKLWDATSAECLRTLKGHAYAVHTVSLSSDRTKIVSGSDDHTVKLWDAIGGECLQHDHWHYSDALRSRFHLMVPRLRRRLRRLGCEERLSADPGGTFRSCARCVIFSRWSEGCVLVS